MATDYDAKIAALEAAIGSGVLTIESGGERITYASVEQMLKALSYLQAQKAKASVGGAYATTLATFGGE